MIGKNLRLLLLCIAASLVSCIDGHEEIWIEPNGSGSAKITYTIPAAVLSSQGGAENIHARISGHLDASKGIHDGKVEVSEQNGRARISASFRFDSFFDLGKLFPEDSSKTLPSATDHFAGKSEILLQGLNVNFSRTISPGKALPGAAFFPASRWEGHTLRYAIHLPHSATSSNATRTENHDRTLIWEIPLADAIRKPFVTQFQARVPFPRWIFPALLLPPLALGWWWLRRRNKRRAFKTTP